MIFIEAGNRDQAEIHARINNFKAEDWRYVVAPRTLYGRRGTIQFVGTFWSRRDSGTIYEVACYRGML